MNRSRRTILNKAIQLIRDAEELLIICGNEEQEYADNMPDNLQGSEKFERAEEIATEILDAAEECTNIIDMVETTLE